MVDGAAEATLHERGWRQGSVFAAPLASTVYVVEDGVAAASSQEFPLWVVASQDCDLAATAAHSSDAMIEIRPVHRDGDLPDWGIRSRKVRLDRGSYVDASDPRVLVSPAALSSLAAHWEGPLVGDRATAFKTWLGLRYDRPAVPPEFVQLARAIAEAVKETRTANLADDCHDVLMQFRTGHPNRFVLWAVVKEGTDPQPFGEWLTQAALHVGDSLGILDREPIVVTKRRLSLDVIENSYAADLSMITWGRLMHGAG